MRVDGGEADPIVDIQGFDFANGEVSSSERGGILYIQSALVQMSDSVIRNGRANFGGGVYLQLGGDLTLSRSIVRDNVAGNPESFGGGGITQRGGGIYNLAGNVTIRQSSIIDNVAVRGGGLANWGGLMRVENSAVMDNEAKALGGGIENFDSQGETGRLHLSFVTLTGNDAGTSNNAPESHRAGGGVYNNARMYVASTVMAQNTTPWSPGQAYHSPDCWSPDQWSASSYRNNVVGVLDGNCELRDYSWGTTAWIDHGTGAAPLNPMLGARNDWSRPHRVPMPGSPLLDAGASPTASLYPCPDLDIRDRDRPVGAGCDIGAAERG